MKGEQHDCEHFQGFLGIRESVQTMPSCSVLAVLKDLSPASLGRSNPWIRTLLIAIRGNKSKQRRILKDKTFWEQLQGK